MQAELSDWPGRRQKDEVQLLQLARQKLQRHPSPSSSQGQLNLKNSVPLPELVMCSPLANHRPWIGTA